MTTEAIAAKLKRLLPDGCRRVLFINPPNVPEEDHVVAVALDNRYPVYPPYGEGILAADLQSRGYVTDILDLNYLLQQAVKTDPNNFRYASWQDWLKARLDQFRPEVVAVTCMFSVSHRQMLRTAEAIKRYDPVITVFAGGNVPSLAAETTLCDASIDFIGLFEGNESFGDTLDFTNGRITAEQLTQLATLFDGQYMALERRTPVTQRSLNLAPHYHDLPIGNYSALGRIGTFHWLFRPEARAATVLANRGCRAHCSFCSVRAFNGNGVVTRDITTVVDEIEHLQQQYGISHIMWLDDDLFYDPRRTVALFNAIVQRKLDITWCATNGVIASATTEEIVQAAAESGCIALSFGIESGDEAILRHVHKPSGVKHFYRAAEILKRYPQIFTKGLLMVGFPPDPLNDFPGETIGQMRNTVKLGREIGLDWYTTQPLNLIPGVEITNHAIVQGLIDEKKLVDGTERPHVSAIGAQRTRESQERRQALPFTDLLASAEPDYVPKHEELKDIWLVMDFRVNYDKITTETNPLKLTMLHQLFVNMCDHTHHENALGNLYFAILELKLNRPQAARQRLALARQFVRQSDYWQKRFRTLSLNRLMQMVGEQIAFQQQLDSTV